ncbi:hypothetical protein AX768_20540 [Burkholderia sp. PAMC 28687]|nr:hypothetical protein AX768_20540 [Burkholderia sp. PAMC 28687]
MLVADLARHDCIDFLCQVVEMGIFKQTNYPVYKVNRDRAGLSAGSFNGAAAPVLGTALRITSIDAPTPRTKRHSGAGD